MLLGVAGCGARTGLDVPTRIAQAPTAPAGDQQDLCVEIPSDGQTVQVPLQTKAEVRRADVAFLIDVTASMGEEISGIRSSLTNTIVPAIRKEIPDANLAVATFADFPARDYGTAQDVVFQLRQPVTEDVLRVQGAIDRIELQNGLDLPEAHVEALYQLSTGEGFGDFVPASFGCPAGGLGYACFREDALPVILLFTDAPMHNGPSGNNPYFGGAIFPTPHSYAEMIAALRGIRARVLGFNSGEDDTLVDLQQLAVDTSTLGLDGAPLVFDIGARGDRLERKVVQAIQALAGAVVFDVDATFVDADPDDGVDISSLVQQIRPLRAEPAGGVAAVDAEAGIFRGVVSGTLLFFELRLRVPIPRTAKAQRYRMEVRFRGDGTILLDTRIIDIVVPALDGSGGCAK